MELLDDCMSAQVKFLSNFNAPGLYELRPLVFPYVSLGLPSSELPPESARLSWKDALLNCFLIYCKFANIHRQPSSRLISFDD